MQDFDGLFWAVNEMDFDSDFKLAPTLFLYFERRLFHCPDIVSERGMKSEYNFLYVVRDVFIVGSADIAAPARVFLQDCGNYANIWSFCPPFLPCAEEIVPTTIGLNTR